MFRLNKHVDKLRVGDQVTTDFHWNEAQIVRRIISIKRSYYTSSGYAATIDGGEPCKTCGKCPGRPIESAIDATWLIPKDLKVNDEQSDR